MTHLAFATNGSLEQLLGISIVVRGFERSLSPSDIDQLGSIRVAAPVSQHRLILELVGSVTQLEVVCVPGTVAKDDQYFIQLSLIHCTQDLPDDAIVLALDYDHLVLHQPPTFISSTLCVSSEPELRIDAAEGHSISTLNASLIIGTALQIAKIGSTWETEYRRLAQSLGRRHLVEAALTSALHRMGIAVERVSLDIHGSFSASSPSTALFHYGGDSQASLAMKRILAGEAHRLRGPTQRRWTDVVDGAASRLRNELQDHLLRT